MAVNWMLGMQQGNAGDAFASAFKQGMEDNKRRAGQNALATLVEHPDNPQALSDLARVDPAAAMQFRQQQAAISKEQLAQHQDSIIKGAQVLRQFNPQDQQSYSAALQAAQQAGIDISQVPQQFNPQYVQGVIKLADALKPEAGAQDPSMIREFDIATQRGLVPQGTSFQQYVQMRNPGMLSPVTIPANATVSAPGQAGVPKVTDQSSYDAVPPGGQYQDPDGHIRTKGGQAGQSSPASFR